MILRPRTTKQPKAMKTSSYLTVRALEFTEVTLKLLNLAMQKASLPLPVRILMQPPTSKLRVNLHVRQASSIIFCC